MVCHETHEVVIPVEGDLRGKLWAQLGNRAHEPQHVCPHQRFLENVGLLCPGVVCWVPCKLDPSQVDVNLAVK